MEYAGFLSHGFPILKACCTHWYVPFAVALMTSQPLLTAATRSPDGTYSYSVLGVTLMSEIVKLWVSFGAYASLLRKEKSHTSLRLRDFLEFGVPALIYFINNNLLFLIIQRISSSQFQVLSCFKTAFTAILFRCILKKILSLNKWASVASLTCGAASVMLHNSCTLDPTDVSSGESLVHNDVAVAVFATLASSVLSSLAGVYNELLLKRDGKLHSLHLQNSLLYAWGVVFNLVGLFAFDGKNVMKNGFFDGYDTAVVVLIANNAATGLSISVILKLCDNIVRVFAHTGAMVITAFIETAFMNIPMTPQLPLSIVIVASSSVVYAADGPLKQSTGTRVFLGKDLSGSETELEVR